MNPRCFFRLLPFALLLGLFALPAQSADPPAGGKKVALVVGINKYHHADLNQPKALEFAEADAKSLADLLTQTGYQVTTLTGNDATRQAIGDALDRLRKQPGDGGLFLVALAGHGLKPEGSKDDYFVPFDADKRVLRPGDKDKSPWDEKTLLPVSEVLGHLAASTASARVLLMDACRNDPSAGRGRGIGTGLKVGDLPKNTLVLLSCSEGQRAYEDKAWDGHGAFFYRVLEGLRGKAVDRRGRVMADRLWEHVRDTVPDDVARVIKGGAEQKPFRLISGDVDLGIASARHGGEEMEVEIAKGVTMTFCWIPEGEAQLGVPKAERLEVMKQIKEEKEPDWLAAEAEEVRGKYKTKGFWLAKYPVTQEQWKAVMKNNPSWFSANDLGKEAVKGMDTSRFAVESLCWDDPTDKDHSAQEFLRRMNKSVQAPPAMGKGRFVLPHEDEWEYAYRGGQGNKQAFYFGNRLNV